MRLVLSVCLSLIMRGRSEAERVSRAMDHPSSSCPKPFHHGFTLIELLVVVAILGILAAIAIFNFLEAQTRAKVARAKSDMRTIAAAVELYNIDWNAYPFMIRENKFIGFFGDDFYSNFMCYDVDDGEEAQLSPDGTMCPNNLTTPVAYLAAPPPRDPFIGKMRLVDTDGGGGGWNRDRKNASYFFYNFRGWAKRKIRPWAVAPAPMRFNGLDGPVYQANWAMFSPGPSRKFTARNHESSLSLVTTMFVSCIYDYQWRGLVEGRHSLYDPSNGTASAGGIWRTDSGSIQ